MIRKEECVSCRNAEVMSKGHHNGIQLSENPIQFLMRRTDTASQI